MLRGYPRFALEAAFLVVTAVLTWLFELPTWAVVVVMAAAWLVVVAVEGVASRERSAAVEPAAEAAEREPLAEDEHAFAPAAVPKRAGAPDSEPEPQPEREAEVEPPGVPEPELVRKLEPRVDVELEPLREPDREAAPPGLEPPEPPSGFEREWNLWELERMAREQARDAPARHEEWAFLFVYLRDFADADGLLPAHFDGLVRESFADLIGSPAR